jgi:serine/threonine protein kinase
MKPQNMLMGAKSSKKMVYLIDFGLSKSYIDKFSKVHIGCTAGKGAIGTQRYMSINAHKGLEQSRRDDLESLFYIAIQFLRGSLPWEGL